MSKYIDADEITPIMAEYVADVFSRKEHLDNISYGYCMEIADVFRQYAERAQQEQQEQQEVDYNKFEKLFHDFCESNKGHHITSHDACMWFWELGLKGRKEDTK